MANVLYNLSPPTMMFTEVTRQPELLSADAPRAIAQRSGMNVNQMLYRTSSVYRKMVDAHSTGGDLVALYQRPYGAGSFVDLPRSDTRNLRVVRAAGAALATSTFRSGTPWSAWWRSNGQICATQGLSFVKTTQQRVKNRLASIDANLASQITVDGAWGAHTQAGLLRVAQADNAESGIVNGLAAYQQTQRGQAIGEIAVQAALALIDTGTTNSATNYELPDGTLTPQWDVSAPSDASNAGQLLCVSPNGASDADFPVAVGSAPTPKPPPGTTAPQTPGTIAPTGAAAGGWSGLSNTAKAGIIAGAVVVTGGLGYGIYRLAKKSKR